MSEQENAAPTAEQEKMHQERLAECIPIAKKILEIIEKYNFQGKIEFGDNDKVRKSLQPVAEEIIALMLSVDMKWSDRKFVFQLALQPVGYLGEIVENALGISWDRAMAKKWGKDALDLKMSDVHGTLMEIALDAKKS